MSTILGSNVFRSCVFTGIGAALLISTGVANGGAADDENLAVKLTTLYRSARGVISKNQALINDASKGNKGLDGAKVIDMAKANFKKATGKDLSSGNVSGIDAESQKAMLAAINDVMTQAQGLINKKGMGLKGFLPAIFARQVAESFSQKMKGKMFIKLTAPKNYVRNRSNRPDSWEHKAIESKFKSSGWEKGKTFSEVASHKGRKKGAK